MGALHLSGLRHIHFSGAMQHGELHREGKSHASNSTESESQTGSARFQCQGLHLQGAPRVCIRALCNCSQEGVQHQALHVGPCQCQQVVQAFVPGLEGTVAARVLPQAQGHCVQQLCGAIPAWPCPNVSIQATCIADICCTAMPGHRYGGRKL